MTKTYVHFSQKKTKTESLSLAKINTAAKKSDEQHTVYNSAKLSSFECNNRQNLVHVSSLDFIWYGVVGNITSLPYSGENHG